MEVIGNWIVKVLAGALPLLVRWYYTPEKIQKGIRVAIRGSGEGVVFDGSDIPKIRIWLVVTNLSLVKIEVESIVGRICYGNLFCEINHFRKHSILTSADTEIFLECWLNEFQVRHLKTNLKNKFETKLFMVGNINTSVHNFELSRELATNNVQFINLLPFE